MKAVHSDPIVALLVAGILVLATVPIARNIAAGSETRACTSCSWPRSSPTCCSAPCSSGWSTTSTTG